MTKAKQKNHKGRWVVGSGALALALAGAYFLYASKYAEVNRKQVKAWMSKFEKEFLKDISKLKEVSEENYHKAIDVLADRYEKMKSVDSKDLKKFVANLKKHWKEVAKHIKK